MWHRENPELYDKEKAEVEAHFPNLHLGLEGDIVFVHGSFAVMFEGHVSDRYSIELQLPRDHPKSLPLVREVGGRIPHHNDRHINPADGTACVLIPDERWRLWPQGAPLLNFLIGPVHSFFLAQSLVEAGEPWPFGQWAHGAKGIFRVLSRNPEDLGSARDHHLPGIHYGKEGEGTLAVSVQERLTPAGLPSPSSHRS